MTPRRFLLATSVVAVTACGISAVGEFVDKSRPTEDGGGSDGPFLLPDGARLDGGDGGATDSGADVDPQVACLAVCDAGCDAGTCVIDCKADNACKGGAVKCPPGVPCAVQCGGKTSCDFGVDCTQASKCNIDCTGELSCAGKVACGGSSCAVECTGVDKTCAAGVECDAGDCRIHCAKEDCKDAPVVCTGDTCQVICGVDASASEKDGCKKGVTCTARQSCTIDCNSEATCQGGVVVDTDGSAAVNCNEKAACKGGVNVVARDASIVCGADDTCEGYVACDAGHCTFDCRVSDKNITACCFAPNCVPDSGTCTAVTYGCQ